MNIKGIVICSLLMGAVCSCGKKVSSELPKGNVGVSGVDKYNELATRASGKETVFMFDGTKSKVNGKQDGSVAADTQEVVLYLGDNLYYPVYLPSDMEIITDNSKYIYAKDQSLNISVVSNAPIDNLSDFVSIKGACSVKPDLIRTEDLSSKQLAAAKYLVNDKAIILRTYGNPVAFNTVFDGLEDTTSKTPEYSGLIADKKTSVVKELPKYTGYQTSVDVGVSKGIQDVYAYTDGSLTVLQEFKRFDDACRIMGTKVAIVAKSDIADKVYSRAKCFYAEKDEYTIAVISVNFNTSITLFGVGDEARFNLLAFIRGNEL